MIRVDRIDGLRQVGEYLAIGHLQAACSRAWVKQRYVLGPGSDRRLSDTQSVMTHSAANPELTRSTTELSFPRMPNQDGTSVVHAAVRREAGRRHNTPLDDVDKVRSDRGLVRGFWFRSSAWATLCKQPYTKLTYTSKV